MFHHLPGDHEADIAGVVDMVARRHSPQPFHATGIRFLGHGNAYSLAMPAMVTVRAELAGMWQGWLTPQDRQKWQPHVTIQNKVSVAEARRLHAQLAANFLPNTGMVQGLQLWRYLDGPWQEIGCYEFATSLETR